MSQCPFCKRDVRELVYKNELVFAVRDLFPVSEGHTLIIPNRHVESYFDATPLEKQAIWEAVEHVKIGLDEALAPQGYNVGFNSGQVAGQTVMHLHVHVIPRYVGDTPDPRGGVRGVIPNKQKYDPAEGTDGPPTSTANDPFASLADFVPGEDFPFLQVLQAALKVSHHTDIVSAFVQKSGVDELEGPLTDALDRGAKIRILTGDYLGITNPHALQRLYTLATQYEHLQARLFRVEGKQAFHPKAYIFSVGAHGAAFVGSSNVSRSALTDGIEWNLKSTSGEPGAFKTIQKRFASLFDSPQAKPLSPDLLKDYQSVVRVPPQPEPAALLPTPHPIQAEVLEKLHKTRDEGARRGLVVMATGLGKTFLSAFDAKQTGAQRVLFVAHRQEILEQAATTWSRVFPDRTIGFLIGGQHEPDAQMVFASVQTLSKVRHLRRFTPTHFDYIVIDEFHHAAAASYRKLLGHFTPRFLLGLTATPDRMDGAALLELCDGNLVARIGLTEGIARDLLVPFQYFGVADKTDFAAIPWRSGRFDMEALLTAQATHERANQALDEYRSHAPATPRSLIFCSSRRHADFIADHFNKNGIHAASVHSGPSSAPRTESLEKLRSGELEAIVAVDIFNEGVDLPDVNTILMLRPTESPIIFLQQLGRGLRKGQKLPKTHLTVVDFIGNHRAFLVKPQALLALSGQPAAPGDALRRIRDGLLDLPEGCSVEISTEAMDMLGKVARISNKDHLIYTYLQLRDHLARRPTAREVYSAGTLTKPIKANYGTWFHFLDAMGDLELEEQHVLGRHETWFRDLTTTQMSRSYKMVALEVLDDAEALHGEIDVNDLSERCRNRILRDPLLRAELSEHEEAGGDLADFTRRWREMPLRIFHRAKGFSQRWFTLEKDAFRSELQVEESDQAVFDAMTAELVDLRLQEFISRKLRFADKVVPFTTPVELIVSHSSHKPILRFDRGRSPHVPLGETSVHVDGQAFLFRFVKIAVNVAKEIPGGPNVLPRLMRSWFGPTAGQPGTRHRVSLLPTPGGGWSLRPRLENQGVGTVIPLGKVPFYPELAVACGVATGQYEGHDVADSLAVKSDRTLSPEKHFVVRVRGDSMNQGRLPMQDGDLVLCEWVTASDPNAVEGKPMLLTGGSPGEVIAQIKCPIQTTNGWLLRSTNPNHADQPIDEGTTLRVVAKPLEVVEERQAPTLWGLYDRDAIAGLFGHKNNPSWKVGHRDITINDEAHTVLMINLRKGPSTKPEHRYADTFIDVDELHWESQASTRPDSAKGQRILNQKEEGRTIHLFVRYNTKSIEGHAEPYTYCGTVQTLRHEGSKPIKVWFRLDFPLPLPLWQAWNEG